MLEYLITSNEMGVSLSLMSGQLQNLSVPISQVLDDSLLIAHEQVEIGKGALYGGVPWAPWAPSTAKKHAQERVDRGLLIMLGGLLDSLVKGEGGNIYEVTPNSGVIGTEITNQQGFPYPLALQYGTSRMPARPFLVWVEERFPLYDEYFDEWILNGQ